MLPSASEEMNARSSSSVSGANQTAVGEAAAKNTGGRYDNIAAATRLATLLPVWISAYRFHDRTFRFLVNARTGEVQGERPYSWIKITLAVLAAVVAIIIIMMVVQQQG